jgi:hypothetical protein
MAKKKIEELKTLENPATNTDGGFALKITEKDLVNFPELEKEGVINGDEIFIPNESILESDDNIKSFNQPDKINNNFIFIKSK